MKKNRYLVYIFCQHNFPRKKKRETTHETHEAYYQVVNSSPLKGYDRHWKMYGMARAILVTNQNEAFGGVSLTHKMFYRNKSVL